MTSRATEKRTKRNHHVIGDVIGWYHDKTIFFHGWYRESAIRSLSHGSVYNRGLSARSRSPISALANFFVHSTHCPTVRELSLVTAHYLNVRSAWESGERCRAKVVFLSFRGRWDRVAFRFRRPQQVSDERHTPRRPFRDDEPGNRAGILIGRSRGRGF